MSCQTDSARRWIIKYPLLQPLGLLSILLATDIAVPAQDPLVLLRVSAPIVLDGLPDEPAWQTIPPLPLTVTQPVYRAEASERTEIRVAYDDNFVYVSGRCYTRDPSTIRLNSLYRDRWSGDDTFGFMLDTFYDRENAVRFITTPGGIRIDQTISNDGEGGSASRDNSWNTFWDVATTVTDSGWFVEMRIPFSSLRFRSINGEVTMGMTVYRWIAVSNERQTFPDVPPTSSIERPSRGYPVVFRGIQQKTPIYVTPYAVGGFDRRAELDPTRTTYRHISSLSREIGIDLKYPIVSNLTLDLTLNTDFAQAEADDQQINLTRFPLFFPEKRQFFLERAGIFNLNMGTARSMLFHSRRIGLNDRGEPIRVLGGARVIGRLGNWDLGALTMQTAREKGLSPENFGVLRVRRQVINAQSYVGGMMTSRINADGGWNYAYALDGILNIVGDEFVTFTWAQTVDRARLKPSFQKPFTAGRIALEWQRRVFEGFSYLTKITWSDAEFEPGLGFDPRRDFSFVRNNLDYQWFLKDHETLRRIWIGHWGFAYVRNPDHRADYVWLHPFVQLEWQNAATVLISTDHYYENVPQAFSLSSSASVPAGSYWYHDVWLAATPPDRWFFRPSLDLFYGTFYDGKKTTLKLSAIWNLSRHLELRPQYELNVIRFERRQQRYDSHLLQLRIQTALNTRASAALFLQYNSAASIVISNVRLRYNFNEGHDLWLVYNEGINTDRDRLMPSSPRLPLTNARAILLKYLYTFEM
jgi:hypothetical protein